MTIFDLLFILCFLSALFALTWAAIAAIRGKYSAALATLRTLAICFAIYSAVVLTVSAASARKVYRIGDTQCFDDWCIAVTAVSRQRSSVEVGLRLSSRARRVPQGEKGTVVYLIDARGKRFDPATDPSAISFDTLLQPGESILTKRRFNVPETEHGLSLVYTHEGGFPIGDFIIGENTWFHGPPAVRLE